MPGWLNFLANLIGVMMQMINEAMHNIQQIHAIILVSIDKSKSAWFISRVKTASIEKKIGVSSISRKAFCIHAILKIIRTFQTGIRASHRCLFAFLKITHKHTIHHIHVINDVIMGRANISRIRSYGMDSYDNDVQVLILFLIRFPDKAVNSSHVMSYLL